MGSDNKSGVKIIVIVLALIAAGAVVLMRRQPPAQTLPDQAYYYDLSTGEIYAAKAGSSPVDLAGDGSVKGVTASVRTCGACTPDEWQIAYLIGLSDAAVARIDEAQGMTDEMLRDAAISDAVAQGTIVAAAPGEGDIAWFAADTPEGAELLIGADQLCGDARPTTCTP